MQQKTAFSFLTGNPHKFQEAKEALAQFPGIELSQIIEEKTEFKDDNASDPISEIAKKAALEALKKYKVPVAVEDAGIFFTAYPGFPGLNTKWVMRNIGYDGILRLLDGKDRTVYFRSIVAYCEPSYLQRGEEPMLFEGRIDGSISAEVIGKNMDCMDYDRIFIPLGETQAFSLIMEVKRKMSHRKIAFQKLGEFLLEKTK
jgi:XTP/dITP diphosphohydrolase